MNEHSLHSAIKSWYSLPSDQVEVGVYDFIIDLARDDLLIEIQTRNFSAIKGKLRRLIEDYRVRLVHPIPENKWIVKVDENGEVLYKRRCPRKGKLTDLFRELIRIPSLVGEEKFSLEILLIDEEEVRCKDGRGSWRRRGVSIKDRKLLHVNSRVLFNKKDDYLRFLPESYDTGFTNRALSNEKGIPISIAQKITYCLRKGGLLRVKERKGRKLVFIVDKSR